MNWYFTGFCAAIFFLVWWRTKPHKQAFNFKLEDYQFISNSINNLEKSTVMKSEYTVAIERLKAQWRKDRADLDKALKEIDWLSKVLSAKEKTINHVIHDGTKKHGKHSLLQRAGMDA